MNPSTNILRSPPIAVSMREFPTKRDGNAEAHYRAQQQTLRFVKEEIAIRHLGGYHTAAFSSTRLFSITFPSFRRMT